MPSYLKHTAPLVAFVLVVLKGQHLHCDFLSISTYPDRLASPLWHHLWMRVSAAKPLLAGTSDVPLGDVSPAEQPRAGPSRLIETSERQ